MYLMSADFDVMANVLYAMCLVFIISVLGDVVLQSCNGNIRNRICGYISPFHTSFYYNIHYICFHGTVSYTLRRIRRFLTLGMFVLGLRLYVQVFLALGCR